MFHRYGMVLVIAASVSAMTVSVTQAQISNVFNMPAGETSLQFVTVGDPGNAPDTAVMDDDTTGYGSVGYVYQMGKYDVTVGQYCQFLNAVAKTDTYGLYRQLMGTYEANIKITQTGSSGNYSYTVAGMARAANYPIFDVSWADAARFCNWLQNGQPVFPAGTAGEVAGSTETGAYSINGAVTDAAFLALTRNAGATYVIPTENEWYKAAYYKGGGTNAGYWNYSTQSNTAPHNTLPDAGNGANYYVGSTFTDPTNSFTQVGAFSESPGPYGTFDMDGDVFQWNDATLRGVQRGLRGGCWGDTFDSLESSCRWYGESPASDEDCGVGFRVAMVPEPSTIALWLVSAACLLGYAWRRRTA
jgi:formylglycine-generating enzyme required for sulfatase activity